MAIRSMPLPVNTPPTDVTPGSSGRSSRTPAPPDAAARGGSERAGNTSRWRRSAGNRATACRRGPAPGFARDGPLPPESRPGVTQRTCEFGSCPRHQAGKGDRGQERLLMARRQADDQPPDPALPGCRQFRGDDLDMPAHRERGPRVELGETAQREAREVAPRAVTGVDRRLAEEEFRQTYVRVGLDCQYSNIYIRNKRRIRSIDTPWFGPLLSP